MTRIALDSNVLAYLAGVSRSSDDDEKIPEVRSLIGRLADQVSLIAPAQAVGELFVVLRRSGAPADKARAILIEFADAFGTSASEFSSVLAAADLVVDHKLQFWDSLILTAAANAAARCSYLKICKAGSSHAASRSLILSSSLSIGRWQLFKRGRRSTIGLVELRGIKR